MNKLFIFIALGYLPLFADQNYQPSDPHSQGKRYNEYYGNLQPYAPSDEYLNRSGYNEYYGKPQPYIEPEDESSLRRGYNEYYGGQFQ